VSTCRGAAVKSSRSSRLLQNRGSEDWVAGRSCRSLRLLQFPQLIFYLCWDLPCDGLFQGLFEKTAVWAFQHQAGEEALMDLTNALCQQIKHHADA